MKIYKQIILGLCCLTSLASCSDMLDTKSDMVEFEEDNRLNTPQDSLYSVMGIIRQMQVIADRTVLLGEVRSDLVVPTSKATTAIKNMAAGDFSADNEYNRISDYYAVINNCNYFLAHVDTTLTRLGKKIFEKEYPAVKAYRAWTYLQMAKVYGEVPLVTAPVMTEADAEREMNKPGSDINAICDYFINDLRPYIDRDFPDYGEVNGFESTKFFIPMRVLLGEMCLWTGRYDEACQYLYQYLTRNNRTVATSASTTRWNVNTDFNFANETPKDLASTTDITILPMETSEFDGVRSMLSEVMSSTTNNDGYFQVTPSKALFSISAAQNYTVERNNAGNKDTLYVPKTGLRKSYYAGDLRLQGWYKQTFYNRDETDRQSPEWQTIALSSDRISIYRLHKVYLMYAEALNRAGYPESAFNVLKYGLYENSILKHISAKERERAGQLLDFSSLLFSESNTIGIHARGCGDVQCDEAYALPQPSEALATYEDTVAYQIPLVEDMIITENALEFPFEGHRYYDLMRVALRRNDPSYLAEPVSKRTGTRDEAVYTRLMDKQNWYLPKK